MCHLQQSSTDQDLCNAGANITKDKYETSYNSKEAEVQDFEGNTWCESVQLCYILTPNLEEVMQSYAAVQYSHSIPTCNTQPVSFNAIGHALAVQ